MGHCRSNQQCSNEPISRARSEVASNNCTNQRVGATSPTTPNVNNLVAKQTATGTAIKVTLHLGLSLIDPILSWRTERRFKFCFIAYPRRTRGTVLLTLSVGYIMASSVTGQARVGGPNLSLVHWSDRWSPLVRHFSLAFRQGVPAPLWTLKNAVLTPVSSPETSHCRFAVLDLVSL